MPDNEIIRMLECWSTLHGCTGCPLIEQGCFDCGNISMDISKNILDLINRQKAEIERLSNENVSLKYDLQVASEESIEWKTQAIKEFAERLKNDYSDILHGAAGVEVREINNLVKEMTEE